jgi:hypothetical protein
MQATSYSGTTKQNNWRQYNIVITTMQQIQNASNWRQYNIISRGGKNRRNNASLVLKEQTNIRISHHKKGKFDRCFITKTFMSS